MEDAPPAPPKRKRLSAQLAQTYTVIERLALVDNSAVAGYSGLNERGETATVSRSSERPVIHQSGHKRPRAGSEDGKATKRVCLTP